METLKKNRSFKKVYSQGNSSATQFLVLYWLKNNKNKNRFGFSIGKKIGNAVQRNKLKRRLKEILRAEEKKENIKQGFDLIIIARKDSPSLSFKRLKEEVITLLIRTGLGRD